MSSEPLLIDVRDGAAILTLNRPDRMNALSRDLLLALGAAQQTVAEDSNVRAIVITAQGEKAFCAGADLKERRGMSMDDVRSQLALYRTQLGWLDASPIPVIAAINGVAFGGGLELALLCDLRVAAQHAKLGLPETGLGIIPGAGGTQRLPRILGEAKAKELILLGSRLTAQQAADVGLINRVTPSGKAVLEDTMEWIAPIRQGAPIAQTSALAAIDASYDTTLALGLELERVFYDECLRSEDRVEALRAFAAKEKPVFRGK